MKLGKNRWKTKSCILRLEDNAIAETTSSDEANGFNEVSTAGSMTRFLPIDRYLYTINFNELVLFFIGDNYRPVALQD